MRSESDIDIQWMRHALKLAERGREEGEVPVGAVLVRGDEILGEGWNHPITAHDPTAHAEIGALREAASKLENYRLPGTTLYVTLEPCTMCAGAMVHARIERLVFGAYEPRSGAVGSVFNVLASPEFNHKVLCQGGVLAYECGQMLKEFFQERRSK
jgi:tRNA(adenine34) deaminase